MRLTRLFGLAIFGSALLASGAAFALSQEQRNAIHHVATVTAVDALCDTVEANDVYIVMLLMALDIDLRRPEIADMIKSDTREQISTFKKTPTFDVCAAGLLLYGPEGVNVKNLLMSK